MRPTASTSVMHGATPSGWQSRTTKRPALQSRQQYKQYNKGVDTPGKNSLSPPSGTPLPKTLGHNACVQPVRSSAARAPPRNTPGVGNVFLGFRRRKYPFLRSILKALSDITHPGGENGPFHLNLPPARVRLSLPHGGVPTTVAEEKARSIPHGTLQI